MAINKKLIEEEIAKQASRMSGHEQLVGRNIHFHWREGGSLLIRFDDFKDSQPRKYKTQRDFAFALSNALSEAVTTAGIKLPSFERPHGALIIENLEGLEQLAEMNLHNLNSDTPVQLGNPELAQAALESIRSSKDIEGDRTAMTEIPAAVAPKVVRKARTSEQPTSSQASSSSSVPEVQPTPPVSTRPPRNPVDLAKNITKSISVGLADPQRYQTTANAEIDRIMSQSKGAEAKINELERFLKAECDKSKKRGDRISSGLLAGWVKEFNPKDQVYEVQKLPEPVLPKVVRIARKTEERVASSQESSASSVPEAQSAPQSRVSTSESASAAPVASSLPATPTQVSATAVSPSASSPALPKTSSEITASPTATATVTVQKVANFKKDNKPLKNARLIQVHCPPAILKAFQEIIVQSKIPGTSFSNPYTGVTETFPKEAKDFTARHLQILARNECLNGDGQMNVGLYNGLLTEDQIASIRCLVKATTVTGKVEVMRSGGYPGGNPIIEKTPSQNMIVIDQAGFQWQNDHRNTGGLFFYPNKKEANYAVWQEQMYKAMYGTDRPKEPSQNVLEVQWGEKKGKLDLDGVALGIQCEFMQALESAAAQGQMELGKREKINFRYLKAGMGFFADGLFSEGRSGSDHPSILLARLQGIGAALNTIKSMPDEQRKQFLGKVGRLELPFSQSNDEKITAQLMKIKSLAEDIGLEWGGAGIIDALHDNPPGYITAVTNTGDPHAMPGNEGRYASVDAAISTNARINNLNVAFNKKAQLRPSQDPQNLLTGNLQATQKVVQPKTVVSRFKEGLDTVGSTVKTEAKALKAKLHKETTPRKNIGITVTPREKSTASDVTSTHTHTKDPTTVSDQTPTRERSQVTTASPPQLQSAAHAEAAQAAPRRREWVGAKVAAAQDVARSYKIAGETYSISEIISLLGVNKINPQSEGGKLFMQELRIKLAELLKDNDYKDGKKLIDLEAIGKSIVEDIQKKKPDTKTHQEAAEVLNGTPFIEMVKAAQKHFDDNRPQLHHHMK